MNLDGEDVALEERSGRGRYGGGDKGWLTGELSPFVVLPKEDSWVSDSGGESRRFLKEDVLTVKALLPVGNKA